MSGFHGEEQTLAEIAKNTEEGEDQGKDVGRGRGGSLGSVLSGRPGREPVLPQRRRETRKSGVGLHQDVKALSRNDKHDPDREAEGQHDQACVQGKAFSQVREPV